jgi:hypothetical protein
MGVAELVESAVGWVIQAWCVGDEAAGWEFLRSFVEDTEGFDAVDRALFERLQRDVRGTWARGWQPADLVRVAERAGGGRYAAVMTDAIAAQMTAHPQASVDRRWQDQLAALPATVWWERDETYLDDWRRRQGLDRREAVSVLVELMHELTHLPSLPMLCPLPGEARARRTAGPAVEPRMLERVRALLAKAESTEFAEEAEALTAKAQELMARHSIDAALLAVAGAIRDEPIGWRIGIDAPYEGPKVGLLMQVAEANRCRVVWSKSFGFATVLGFEGDLHAVELLFLSLLVQATTAMVRAGSRRTSWGASRTRAFRQSFLTAFGTRIGERLRTVTAGVTGEVDAGGAGLLPVLASRDEAVREKAESYFPRLGVAALGSRRLDAEGWAYGTAAADQARLHTAAGHIGDS